MVLPVSLITPSTSEVERLALSACVKENAVMLFSLLGAAALTVTVYSAVVPSSAVTVYVTGLEKLLDVYAAFLLNSSYFQFGTGTDTKSRNPIG